MSVYKQDFFSLLYDRTIDEIYKNHWHWIEKSPSKNLAIKYFWLVRCQLAQDKQWDRDNEIQRKLEWDSIYKETAHTTRVTVCWQ